MQAQPQQAQALLKLAERTAFLGVWVLDLEHNRLHWSDQLALIHGALPGYSPNLENAYDHYVEEHREGVAAQVRACCEQGTPFDTEAQIVTLQGRRAWVRCIGQAVRGEDGRITGVEGLLQEIAPPGYPGASPTSTNRPRTCWAATRPS